VKVAVRVLVFVKKSVHVTIIIARTIKSAVAESGIRDNVSTRDMLLLDAVKRLQRCGTVGFLLPSLVLRHGHHRISLGGPPVSMIRQ
jgi:hypothetical protein